MPRPAEFGLPRVQRWMQAVIEHPGTADEAVAGEAARRELDLAEIERVILPSKTLTAVERVGVYQGMYLLRMVEALEGDYPGVAHFLGGEEFRTLVSRYTQAHPSTSYTLSRLGDRFPEFVRRAEGIRNRAFLADLAKLELLVTQVFDARESPAWPADAIARIPEESWDRVVFQPVAAFRLGAFAYPVNAYLQSVKEDDHDHPDVGRKATHVAVWRKRYEVWRLDLSKPAYEFLHALAKGRPFGKAVASAAGGLPGNAGEQLFRWLRDWVGEGMFEGVRQRPEPRKERQPGPPFRRAHPVLRG